MMMHISIATLPFFHQTHHPKPPAHSTTGVISSPSSLIREIYYNIAEYEVDSEEWRAAVWLVQQAKDGFEMILIFPYYPYLFVKGKGK